MKKRCALSGYPGKVKRGQTSPAGGWDIGEYSSPSMYEYEGVELNYLIDCEDCIYFCLVLADEFKEWVKSLPDKYSRGLA